MLCYDKKTKRLEGEIWCGRERVNNGQREMSMVEEMYGLLDVWS
jgi:hypothetical protein